MKTKHLLVSLAFGLGLALAVALLVLLGGAQQTARADPGTIHVSTTGADGPTCGAATSPCRTIPYAVHNRADAGDTVFVAPGTYTETFALKAGVVIEGAGPGLTIVDGENVRGPLVTADGLDVDTTAVLRGFTIRRGQAESGGGLSINEGAMPTIEDCAIQENTATANGGGVRIYDLAAPTFRNVQVLSNTAGGHGGGVYAYWYAFPIFDGGRVEGNQAADTSGGGGLYFGWYSSPNISGTQIVGNSAPVGQGGGLLIGDHSEAFLTNMEVLSNTARNGGGIQIIGVTTPTISGGVVGGNIAHNSGGGIHLTSDAAPLIIGVVVRDNRALGTGSAGGGGMYITGDSSPSIDGCLVEGNTTAGQGGGLYVRDGWPMVDETQVLGNEATWYGGGVYLHMDTHLTLLGGEVSSNQVISYSGGGLYIGSGASALISGTLVADNAAPARDGGGMYLAGMSQVDLFAPQVVGNQAIDGGGIIIAGVSTTTITGGEMRGNTATNSGGGLYISRRATPLIEDLVVRDNRALGEGFWSGGGGIYIVTDASPTIRDTEVVSNHAVYGGGYRISAPATIIGGEVRGNSVAEDGGGLHVYQAAPTLRDLRVLDNTATWFGGGMYIHWYSSPSIAWGEVRANRVISGSGGGIFIGYGSSPVISGTQVVSNAAALGVGGGVYIGPLSAAELYNDVVSRNRAGMGDGVYVAAADPTLVNATVADNLEEGIFADAASNPTIINTILWGNGDDLVNAAATYSDIEDGDAGTGNISADPLFVNPVGGNYHIQAGSPCVDAGDPAGVPPAPPRDIDAEGRPFGEGVDIGADEVWPCIPPVALSLLGPPTTTVGVPAFFMAIAIPPTVTRPITYTWEATEQTTQVHFGDPDDTAEFTWEVTGVKGITLTVESCGPVIVVTHTITVTNEPPVAEAGPDQNVWVNDTVTLDGSGSYDPDGHLPLTFGWRQVGGPPVTLTVPGAMVATFTAPDGPTVLTFTLTVTDAYGLADPTPDEVVVTVEDIPIAGLSAENSSPTKLGQPTFFTATVMAGSNVVYGWAFGDEGTASGAEVSYTYAAAGEYTAVVTASNGAGEVVTTTVVTVTNEPPVAEAGPDRSVMAGAEVRLDGSGSYDPDGHLPLTYGWRQTGGPAVALSDPHAVSPTFTAPDTSTVLIFTLVVTDAYGLADPTPDEVVITVEAAGPEERYVYLPLVVRGSRD